LIIIGQECDIGLTLKSVQVHEAKIYCGQHVPKHKLTNVTDSMATIHATNAPKKASEGLHKTQVGTGEVGNVGMDSISTQHAVNAPKKSVEGLAKTYLATSDAVSKGVHSQGEEKTENDEQYDDAEY